MSTQQLAKDQPAGFSNRIERVAIVGAGGRQGARITEQLLKTGKHTITALTRIGSTSKLPHNVKSIPVDYEDEESLASALKDQQLLIITLAVTVDPEVHHRIVRAAGKAGIRYIIPNIYAANVVIENQGAVDDFFPAAPPINLLKEIERVGVTSWILLVGGVWFDYSLPSGDSFMGFDIDNRRATLFDDGEAKINTSTLAQFGRAAAAIASLKEFPDNEDDKSPSIAQFRNKPVYLSSFYVSQKDILKGIQRVTSTTEEDWEIKFESSADRIENGKAMGRSGNIMGLVQAYYSFILSPEGQKLKTQDKLHNEILGLPDEDMNAVVEDSPASRGTDKLNLRTSNFCQTMSFGFGVGDFIAVGELCWKIYTRVYKVSRDAPEELRALIQELGNLSNTVNLLNEEIRDQEEWIKRAGERRLEYTCKVMGQVKATLQKMDRLADKYAELGKGDGLEGSRRPFRIQWNRVKFAFEVSSINELRHRISPEGPLLNAALDDEDRAELSAAFLRSAEMGNRPWASIAIDDWLHAGKWWLLKVRSQMNHLAQGTEIKVHAYINILKACWILADIVSIHPQRVHLGASNDRRNEDIRNLSQAAKRSLENFPVFEFQLRDVEDNTINIWPQLPPLGMTAPPRQFGIIRDNLGLQTSHGEVLFQCFVEIHRTTEGTVDTEGISEECFLMLEVPRQGIYLNVMLKSFVAHDICKMKLEPGEECVACSDIELFLGSLAEKLGSTVGILNDQGKLFPC
ncbi:oxidoreductase like [Fusarium denticulatum]|uniref:Oxidoreductase like n=1 Tax=Fusarium denticulatum TaxID=48507 RepID=A0A8H6CVF8_9HYPO|nr:oxidoreductase like [Fusarium denticulatum]